LVNIFSVGKALNAIAALRLVEQGRIALDAPLGNVWPEFAANGKETISLRTLLCHKGGLPAIRKPQDDGVMLDWSHMTRVLANERPWWDPGTAHGYHVNTYGFLVGEVVRRASGRTIGRYLREEVLAPLGADFHIGLPASEHARVAEFQWPGNPPKPEL